MGAGAAFCGHSSLRLGIGRHTGLLVIGRQLQLLKKALDGCAVLGHIGQARAVMTEQYGAVPVQNQRQRQLLLSALYRLVALLFGLPQDAPPLQRIAHQRAFACGYGEMLIQHARCIAEQGIGQRVRPDAARQLVRARANHQRKAAVMQCGVGVGIAACKGARDGMAEVRHKDHHQRGAGLQQITEAIVGAVGRVIQKEGESVPNADPLRHGQAPLSSKNHNSKTRTGSPARDSSLKTPHSRLQPIKTYRYRQVGTLRGCSCSPLQPNGGRACNPVPDPDSQYLISRIL